MTRPDERIPLEEHRVIEEDARTYAIPARAQNVRARIPRKRAPPL